MPAFQEQLTVIFGTTSAVPLTVTVSVTVTELSLAGAPVFEAAVNWIERELMFVSVPAQPPTELTVKIIPAVLFVELRTTLAGGVIFSAATGAKPTVIVLVPVGAGNAWTVNV